MKTKEKIKHGTLRVCHFPQVPCKAFEVIVSSLAEAELIMNVLANYDQFQFKHDIKPDYCNITTLMVFHKDEGWIDWCSQDGENIDFYDLRELRENPPKWEFDE